MLVLVNRWSFPPPLEHTTECSIALKRVSEAQVGKRSPASIPFLWVVLLTTASPNRGMRERFLEVRHPVQNRANGSSRPSCFHSAREFAFTLASADRILFGSFAVQRKDDALGLRGKHTHTLARAQSFAFRGRNGYIQQRQLWFELHIFATEHLRSAVVVVCKRASVSCRFSIPRCALWCCRLQTCKDKRIGFGSVECACLL